MPPKVRGSAQTGRVFGFPEFHETVAPHTHKSFSGMGSLRRYHGGIRRCVRSTSRSWRWMESKGAVAWLSLDSRWLFVGRLRRPARLINSLTAMARHNENTMSKNMGKKKKFHSADGELDEILPHGLAAYVH